jgi:hypothetical protein
MRLVHGEKKLFTILSYPLVCGKSLQEETLGPPLSPQQRRLIGTASDTKMVIHDILRKEQ